MNSNSAPHLRPLRFANIWKAIGILMMLVVLIVMIIPTPQVDLGFNYSDKWVHVIVFAAIGAWAAQIYTPSPTLWRVGLGLVAFGAATELIQAVIPWRSADLLDLLADLLGLGLGLSVAATPAGCGLQALERLVNMTRA